MTKNKKLGLKVVTFIIFLLVALVVLYGTGLKGDKFIYALFLVSLAALNTNLNKDVDESKSSTVILYILVKVLFGFALIGASIYLF